MSGGLGIERVPRDESGLAAARSAFGWRFLQTKAELERELGRLLLRCRPRNRRVHSVPGVSPEPGHWSHAEPAPVGHRRLNEVDDPTSPADRGRRLPLPLGKKKLG
jgi:hypothetical protein